MSLLGQLATEQLSNRATEQYWRFFAVPTCCLASTSLFQTKLKMMNHIIVPLSGISKEHVSSFGEASDEFL